MTWLDYQFETEILIQVVKKRYLNFNDEKITVPLDKWPNTQEKRLTCNQIGDHHRNRPMSNRCAIDVVVNCANNHMLRVDHRDKHVLQTTQLLQRPLHAQMPFRVNLQIMKNRNEWEKKKRTQQINV